MNLLGLLEKAVTPRVVWSVWVWFSDAPVHNILIAVLALYCCFMVSANAGFSLLPLLFALPPLVFQSRKKESGEEETIWLGASCLSTSDQS